ncbi:MAG: radical SAM protein [Epulopiscium sp.]|nr:radical SAM protein [Candidatus Epulonipiscium sp.]
MFRVSHYNIYLPMKKQSENYLIVQGYRGSFDVVDKSIAKVLMKGEKDPSYLNEISEENLAVLSKRGYITELEEEKEYELIEKVSHILNTISRKNMCITIMPTYNCNFRCEYCFEQNLLSKGKEWLSEKMTIEMVDAIFEQLRKHKEEGYKIGSVYLFGGEPLLKSNKDIVTYICQKCKEQEIPISCISNGHDLDEYVELLKEYKFERVQITVDGVGEEHDKRRFLVGGQGSYDRIMKNIQLALEKGIHIVVRTNVNKKNIKSIQRLIEEYENRGWVEKENFHYYFKSTLRCYEELGVALSDVELMKELAEYFHEDVERFQFNSIYQGLSSSIRTMIDNNAIAPLRSGYCGANTGMYTIDPYGDIYPCWDVLAEEDCKIGTVDVEKGEFVLNSVNDHWKERTVDRLDECKKCRYMLFCGGGCSAQAKVMHSDMNKVFCDDFTKIFDEVVVEVCEKAFAKSSCGQ